MRSTFKFIGVIAGALSIFSMLHRGFDFGLTTLMADLLAYYRNFTGMIIGPVIRTLHFPAPDFWIDWYTQSFVGAGALYRTRLSARKAVEQRKQTIVAVVDRPIVEAVFVAISGLGFSLVIWNTFGWLYIKMRKQYTKPEYAEFVREITPAIDAYVKELGLILIALLAFFAFNAFGPKIPTS